MKFNENLKAIRKEKGYTQKNMYTILGVSPNCYASWEQGRTQPDIETIKRLCTILAVSADYLLGIENEDGTKTYSYDFEYKNENTYLRHKKK